MIISYPVLVLLLLVRLSEASCMDYSREDQCMKAQCFYLINEKQCVSSPVNCTDRRGMKMCHRAYPKQCRWNQTTQLCQPYEWHSCGATLPCSGNCSFHWDIAECVSSASARNESDMSYYYWCGLDDQHPLQWGLVNQTACNTQKDAHCTYVPAYGLCMPKPPPKRVVRQAVQRWEETVDDQDNDTGYGIFDAVVVLVAFSVLFCLFLVCLDATTQIDSVTYRPRWPGRN